MSVQASLRTSLLALPELGLRLGWLRDRMARAEPGELAVELDELLGRAHSGDGEAREAALVVALAVVQERGSPVVEALRRSAVDGALLSLERLLRRDADLHLVHVDSDLRVPTYSTGRELTVGERRTLTRRPTKPQLDRLVDDPHPLVTRELLKSPRLTESDVLRMLSKRPARLAAIEEVTAHPRWVARRTVRRALILNPGTPASIAAPLVSVCPRDDLETVLRTTTVRPTIRTVALELLALLPPLEVGSDSLQ